MVEAVLGGVYKGENYLAYADLYGNYYESDYIVTSFARYLCPTLIDRYYNKDCTYEQIKEVILICFKAIYSRFKLANDQVVIGF